MRCDFLSRPRRCTKITDDRNLEIALEQETKLGRRSHSYRLEIDGLRAIAVMAVIINHYDRNLLPSGYLGVDMFFVISGYVITTSIISAWRDQDSLTDFLLDFYSRRLKRLAPALILFVAVMSIATVLFFPIPREALETGMAALLGVSNLYLATTEAEYFAASIEDNSFAHTWSLGVEEQFYLFYPVVIWSCFNRKGVWFISKIMLCLSILSLIGFAALYGPNQPAAYFSMPTRLWELAAGTMTYFSFNSLARGRVLERTPTAVVIGAIIGALFAPSGAAVPATIAVVLLTATLVAGLRPGTFAHTILSRREVVYVGLLSYSLYLWHWGVLWLGRQTIGVDGSAAWLEFGMMFLLAGLSYHLVERPFRELQWSRRRALTLAAASVATCCSIAVMIGPPGRLLYLGHILGVPAPTHIQKTWWTDRDTGEYIEKCQVEYDFDARYIDACLASREAGRRHAYLIGDSHARNYLQAVKGAFVDHEVRYLTMGWGCALLPPEIANERSFAHCPDYVEAIRRYLAENVGDGDVVFIGQALWDDRRQTPLYLDFVKKIAREIVGRRASVVLLDSSAPPDKTPEACLVTPWRPIEPANCAITPAAVIGAYAKFDRLAREAAQEIPRFYYAPLRTGLCRDDQCGQTTSAGTPIWHDIGHITEAASSELAPLLRATLEQQGFFARQAVAQ